MITIHKAAVVSLYILANVLSVSASPIANPDNQTIAMPILSKQETGREQKCVRIAYESSVAQHTLQERALEHHQCLEKDPCVEHKQDHAQLPPQIFLYPPRGDWLSLWLIAGKW